MFRKTRKREKVFFENMRTDFSSLEILQEPDGTAEKIT